MGGLARINGPLTVLGEYVRLTFCHLRPDFKRFMIAWASINPQTGLTPPDDVHRGGGGRAAGLACATVVSTGHPRPGGPRILRATLWAYFAVLFLASYLLNLNTLLLHRRHLAERLFYLSSVPCRSSVAADCLICAADSVAWPGACAGRADMFRRSDRRGIGGPKCVGSNRARDLDA